MNVSKVNNSDNDITEFNQLPAFDIWICLERIEGIVERNPFQFASTGKPIKVTELEEWDGSIGYSYVARCYL